MRENPTEANWRSPFLGLGIIVSAFALKVIFSSEGSLEFRTGHTAGAMASSAALSLPLFLAWRYATRAGRQQTLGTAFNAFILLTVVCWFTLFIIVKGVLPSLISRMQPPQTVQHAATAQTVGSVNGIKDPTYETTGWTQESSGSTEIGPWLKFDPPGTRYCRNHDRSIQRLYPLGVRPQAEAANPFCLGTSSVTVPP